ncbi:MAG: substrate-binding domain-containing protein [Clostridia bacterium]|nr:substrate-binding domain-containing protein [Clostridia bacterium]
MNHIKKHLTLILMILIAIFGYWLNRIMDEEVAEISQSPQYHFYYIGKNSTDPYWAAIEDGVREAARTYNVVVEYASPKFSDTDLHFQALDVGVLSKVDGIITYGYIDDRFTKKIDEAVALDIPLVTVESDNQESKRSVFVGTSSYRLGEEAADLLIEATRGEGKILLLRNDLESGNSLDEELRIDGFINRLKPYRNLEVIDEAIDSKYAETAEMVIGRAISAHGAVKAIYTPNSVDTIEAAKYIISKNLVGQVVVIGIGNSKEAINYIKRGIIYGTVMSDPYLMGYKSIEMLIQASENENISVVADTGLRINTYESVLAEEAAAKRQE